MHDVPVTQKESNQITRAQTDTRGPASSRQISGNTCVSPLRVLQLSNSYYSRASEKLYLRSCWDSPASTSGITVHGGSHKAAGEIHSDDGNIEPREEKIYRATLPWTITSVTSGRLYARSSASQPASLKDKDESEVKRREEGEHKQGHLEGLGQGQTFSETVNLPTTAGADRVPCAGPPPTSRGERESFVRGPPPWGPGHGQPPGWKERGGPQARVASGREGYL
jgi:hypothetical protein